MNAVEPPVASGGFAFVRAAPAIASWDARGAALGVGGMASRAEIERRLGARLLPDRYRHSVRTAEYAGGLAARWGADPAEAALAGLLHDCARDIDPAALLKMARGSGILVDAIEAEHPPLLHGKVGAVLASREFGVADAEVLRALETHPTGAADMGPLARVLFVADHAEPGRTYPGVDELRRLAEQDLDGALLLALDMTADFLAARRIVPHPRAALARAAVAARIKGRAAAPR